jgi:hypothetical protein
MVRTIGSEESVVKTYSLKYSQSQELKKSRTSKEMSSHAMQSSFLIKFH